MFQLLFYVCILVQITDSNGKKYGENFKAISNSGQLMWKPKINKVFENRDESDIKKYMGINPQLKQNAEKSGGRKKETANIPKSDILKETTSLTAVDADININIRKKRALSTNLDWRNRSSCASLFHVRYQQCGDCWSVATTSVMSDRYCLWTRKNKFFSARQITTCVYSTGGCDGGWPDDAMYYYKIKGVASGGDPTISTEPLGCLPYPNVLDNILTCPILCNSNLTLDSTKAGDYYAISSKNVTAIMNEIYRYGPVVATMEVYEDFVYYGDGIYHHVYGEFWGYHAVRIIGYGVENNTSYWTVANSWSADWGNLGYFKILRGTNHCGIESWITSVFPAESYT